MAISKESKAAIKAHIETLNAQKKIANHSLRRLEKEVAVLTGRVAEIDATIVKLETDLNG